jgi:hypothetical protein
VKEEEEAGGLASGEWNDYDEHVLLQIRGRLKEERCGFMFLVSFLCVQDSGFRVPPPARRALWKGEEEKEEQKEDEMDEEDGDEDEAEEDSDGNSRTVPPIDPSAEREANLR